jgi:hypothetical protein
MKAYLAAGVAGILIITAGLVNAYWTGVFGNINSDEILKSFAKRLGDVPMSVGDWEGTDDREMDPREREVAAADASLSRRYLNRLTGQAVSVFIVSGHHRAIAQHTPDLCYVAAGFQMLSPPIHYDVVTDDGTVETYTTVFKKDEHTGTQYLRVFWTWSFEGQWLAPNMPRMKLVGHPALYKVYFINEVLQPGQGIEQNAAVDFMRKFIPTLDAALFPDRPAASAEQPPAGEASSPATDSPAVN